MAIIVDPGTDPDTGLSLCTVVFNLAAEPADMCMFTFAGDAIPTTTDSRAEVRQLINRRRLIRRGTRTYESFALDLRRCTSEQVQWLRDHVGQLVCVRDHVGSKAYVVYPTLPREVGTGFYDRTNVKLALEEITHTEGV